jgi:hypothetical protein
MEGGMNMAVEREHFHEHPVVESTTATVREPFGIAQFFCLGIGIFLIVIGAVGLARAGLSHLTTPRVLVGPFSMTPLLALANLLIGVLSLGGAAGRAAARGICWFLGPILIAAGVIALIQPVRQLGWNRADGVIYLIVGGAAMVAAMATPLLSSYEERRITAA